MIVNICIFSMNMTYMSSLVVLYVGVYLEFKIHWKQEKII